VGSLGDSRYPERPVRDQALTTADPRVVTSDCFGSRKPSFGGAGVERGETVCIVGPSGSGKSTLLRCINWLEKPDSGAVFLSGSRVGMHKGGHVAMSDRGLAQIRTRIGMVFQHFALWPHLTVLQNVMEVPLHVQKRPPAEVREAAEVLLQKVGLSDKGCFPGASLRRSKATCGHRQGARDSARPPVIR